MKSNTEMEHENLVTPKVKSWLSRLGVDTARVYETVFTNFMKWVRVEGGEFKDYSPEDFVEFQMEATNSHRYKVVDLLQNFINSEKRRAGYKRKIRSTIRSFFAHSRCELPKDPRFIIRGDEQRVIGTLTIEEVKTMILRCNPVYQAIFLSMLQGGMGISEVEYWSNNGYEELDQQLDDKKVGVIRVSLPGRKKAKNERPYYTLLGSDAIDAIRGWLEKRPENAEAIFTNKYGGPITKNAISLYWRRHLRDLGIITKKYNNDKSNRYGKNPHELRTLFRSQWEMTPAKMSVAEYLMGHQVDPLDYNQAFRNEAWTRKQYDLALPMLQIISSGRPFGQVGEDELEKLRSENRDLQKQIENAQSTQDQRIEDLEEQLRLIQEYIRKKG